MIMALGGRAKGRADGYLCTRQKRTRSRREGLCATCPVLYYTVPVPSTATILGPCGKCNRRKNRFPRSLYGSVLE